MQADARTMLHALRDALPDVQPYVAGNTQRGPYGFPLTAICSGLHLDAGAAEIEALVCYAPPHDVTALLTLLNGLPARLDAAEALLRGDDKHCICVCHTCGHVAPGDEFLESSNVGGDYSTYCPVDDCQSDDVEGIERQDAEILARWMLLPDYTALQRAKEGQGG